MLPVDLLTATLEPYLPHTAAEGEHNGGLLLIKDSLALQGTFLVQQLLKMVLQQGVQVRPHGLYWCAAAN